MLVASWWSVLRATISLACLVIVVCLTGCGGNEAASESTGESDVTGPSSDSVTMAEAFRRGEEAVQACMAGHGFDYEMRPFIADERRSGTAYVESDLLLSDAHRWGYRGVFLGLTMSLAPTGAPPSSMSRSEVGAYDEALVGGANYHFHETDGTPHAHDDDPPHSHSSDGTGIGCQDAGTEVFEAQALRTSELMDARQLRDAYNRIFASDAFTEYEQQWARCFQLAGHEVAVPQIQGFGGPLMAGHSISNQFAFGRRAAEIVGPQTARSTIELIDHAWLVDAVSTSEALQELFDEEVVQAVADHECRSANYQTIRSTVHEALEPQS